jgi:SSS family solute:Na+ symporter
MTPLIIISCYLVLLLGLGLFSSRFFRGTSGDYFHASHSIGPFVLLMSLFGTAMTSFAMVGSTAEAHHRGIGIYGMMASWSGLVHSACFFLVGIKLWALGKRHRYVTQVQYFRERFESNRIGWVLFPILVALLIPYVLIGVLGAGAMLKTLTMGAFPDAFADTKGGIPFWLGAGGVCVVVLLYVFFGGVRGTAWANTMQTIVFLGAGVVAFYLIADKLGGVVEASRRVDPSRLVRGDEIGHLEFLTYCFVPLSVGTFPHIFQHWMTAKSASSFKLTVAAYPICMLILWAPCILIGIWATGAVMPGTDKLVVPPDAPANAIMGMMVAKLTSPLLSGLLGAGILAAIMSSLDSQFLSLGSIFTNDIVLHHFGEKRFSERQKVLMARLFVVAVVVVVYLISLGEPRRIFRLGVWCFSGFSGLFPLLLASLYWRRLTKAGAYASILTAGAVWFYFFQGSGFGMSQEKLVGGVMPVTYIVAAATLAMVAVSWMTKPPSAVTLAKFFPEVKKG